MGPRQHGKGKRRRRQIDLSSLSKKQRKEYRNNDRGQKRKEPSRVETETEAVPEHPETDLQANEFSSSDEETVTPYNQLVFSLKNIDDSEDEGEEEDEEKEEWRAVDDLHSQAENSLTSDLGSGDAKNLGIEDASDADLSEPEVGNEEDLSDNEVIEPGEDVKDFSLQETDPFSIHFEHDLDEDVADEIIACKTWQKHELKVPYVGSGSIQWMTNKLKPSLKRKHETDLKKLHVKHTLCAEASNANKKLLGVSLNTDTDTLTSFQHGLFGVFNEYKDILYTERTHKNGEEIRLVYCLHALNHVLKTRSRVIAHNTKMKLKTTVHVDEEYRDQGLTRPKVLIVVPFRESAKRVVEILMNLLKPSDKSLVSNKKRFFKEYGPDPETDVNMQNKPEDFEAMFEGNIDDYFRIGIGVAKKTLKLYTKFYSADIILSSPLGLRSLIGSEGDKERDYDFLSSIELIILDQADVFMMQNWDHVMHLFDHLHLQPKESHGLDFSRVRMWTLNGWSKYYRQNLVFSSVPVPEVTALFNKHCHNYAGKIQLSCHITMGTICQITVQLPQVFQRIDSTSFKDVPDDRFEHFIKKVLPHHKDPVMAQTFIFIPSYFDFVRLRNYYKREDLDFATINEYSKDSAIAKARKFFGRRKVTFLLYTERCHFYRRFSIRGIRHIIFYGLPQYPHFYSELCNMLQDPRTASQTKDYTCTVLYSKYEVLKLAGIVGTDRASRMINASKNVHMFTTGENG